MSEEAPKLLWVDDDEQRRFRYEIRRITKVGWEVDWAKDAEEAARKLGKEPYQALLLDQMLPYRKLTTEKVSKPWGGCLLLYWLRGKDRPGIAPEVNGFRDLEKLDFPEKNIEIPVMVVSAYYVNEVQGTMIKVSNLDKDLVFAPKPVDIQQIFRFLDKVRNAT